MSESLFSGLCHASRQELAALIRAQTAAPSKGLIGAANALCREVYGHRVFFRGLIEYSNHCAKGCFYCGLNNGNRTLVRYRLSPEEIVACCASACERGFRSVVLQAGEDPYYQQGRMVEVVQSIRLLMPDCAITLSMGELPRSMYQALYDAGADRYLLRQETASAWHYARLHPPGQSLAGRMECLYALKEIGFAVGAGFMVGSPGQDAVHLAEDLIFLRNLQPDMVGIGPFLPHAQTRFAMQPPGGLSQTIAMLALTRLLLPHATLPATTALGALHPRGQEMALLSGANVVMPNTTPRENRRHYQLYDGKPGVGDGLDDGLASMMRRIERIGLAPDFSRGDPISTPKETAYARNAPG